MGLTAAERAEKELAQSDVAEGEWGGGWTVSPPLSLLLSLPSFLFSSLSYSSLFAPSLTTGPAHRLHFKRLVSYLCAF